MFNSAITGDKDIGTLALKGAVTLKDIDKLKEILTDALNRFKKVVVKIESNDEIDFSVFQLFFAAHRSTLNQNKEFIVIPPAGESSRFMQLWQYSGFDRLSVRDDNGEELNHEYKSFIVQEGGVE